MWYEFATTEKVVKGASPLEDHAVHRATCKVTNSRGSVHAYTTFASKTEHQTRRYCWRPATVYQYRTLEELCWTGAVVKL